MTSPNLIDKAANYLRHLTLEIPNRRVGSAGNRAATDFFAHTVAPFGFTVERPEFECLDWAADGAELTVAGQSFSVLPSPYSLGGQFRGPLAVVSTLAQLETVDAAGKILLVRGELAAEQLMPKYYPFYNPEHHQKIVQLLETKAPQAMVAATGRNPELAGGLYPFPLNEDGDFDIPSVYMTEEEGARLAGLAGQPASFTSRARRIPATGGNVMARKGEPAAQRVVICAHIDAKINTPGAIDNATGVVVLLLLAELLADYAGDLGLEIVAFNGEDYYAASGEQQYLSRNAATLNTIKLAINIDAAGYRAGQTAYSLYGCPADMTGAVHRAFSAQPNTVEGEPWVQSDHSIFIMNQIPALAITSDRLTELCTQITHTPQDTPDIVDPAKLVNIAQALRALLASLSKQHC